MSYVPDPSFYSFNTYNILRLPDRAVLGAIELPRRHFAEVRVYRSWQHGPERVTLNTLLVPSVSEVEAAFIQTGQIK